MRVCLCGERVGEWVSVCGVRFVAGRGGVCVCVGQTALCLPHGICRTPQILRCARFSSAPCFVSRETALHIAAKSGRATMVALLLSYGADASLADGNGETPEMLARRGGHSSVLNELAKVGACVGTTGVL